MKKWNSKLYDENHSYVFNFGEDVVELLEPRSGERILDLGCGTGHLTKLISEGGADVTGIDSSEAMISEARRKFASLKFEVKNAVDFSFEEKFDVVFSNAVLHWIPEKEKVLSCIYNCLRNGGRFVAEFGGKNNVQNVISAIEKVLVTNEYFQNIKNINWFFPSIGEYASLLEKHGFEVRFASHFDRDTFLDEGLDVIDWLEMFGKEIFAGIDSGTKKNLFQQIKAQLLPTNLKNDKWFIDYKGCEFLL